MHFQKNLDTILINTRKLDISGSIRATYLKKKMQKAESEFTELIE